MLLLAFIVAGLIFAGLLIMRLRDGNPSPAVAMNAPPAAAFLTLPKRRLESSAGVATNPFREHGVLVPAVVPVTTPWIFAGASDVGRLSQLSGRCIHLC